MTLYNELEPFAAEWMRNLIAGGHISPGAVDERSIVDLRAADVAGPGQRHFFAGIGGWSYALRLAGVPDDADVWTGSCPCQPFSAAGKRGGLDDARHLWPEWFRLIAECRPSIVFGEQVASPDGLAWLDAVSTDLEGAGYAVAAADLCAAGIGAPHIRQRLYFVAYADDARPQGRGKRGHGAGQRPTRPRGVAGRMGNPDGQREGEVGGVQAWAGTQRARGTGDPWRSAEWLPCLDGRSRPVPAQPALFPLAARLPNRVGSLRGSGNAIVPQVAAAFVTASLEAIGDIT